MAFLTAGLCGPSAALSSSSINNSFPALFPMVVLQNARNADSWQLYLKKRDVKTAGGCYKPEHCNGGRDHGIAIAAQAYYACTVPVHIITGGNDHGGHGNARRPPSLC